jgi:hypothetical protein
VENTYNKKDFPTVVGKFQIVLEFSRYCMWGHSFYITLLTEFRIAAHKHCLSHKGSKLVVALDLSGKSFSCPLHPETEIQALFIGCICSPSIEMNKLVKTLFF